ncbi:hypothetical protein Vadar_000517 [Vaccinium darrowii]|uniref:Uncharacterized protein n=1 Tax=Vaccinium darrowii TaxID=229202 RepID=A0ACB7X6K5_9ERIC|nr:hypothetical protein Vadar_000517 [Vaccinium darrowii]
MNSWYGECNRSEPSSETSAEAREQNSHAHAHAHTQPQGKEKYSFVLMNPFSSLYLNSSSTGTQTVNEFSTVFQSERMIGQLLSSNQENNVYESQPMAGHCWWRSAAKFDECANLGIQNLSKVTPRLKVLREMERLALVALEGLDELRQKLFNYRCGDFWVPTGGIKKEEMIFLLLTPFCWWVFIMLARVPL